MAEAADKDKVDTPSVAYTYMASKWELTNDLRGGTFAMRTAGAKWLPQDPKENHEAYSNRLSRSFLFPKYNDTIEKLGGKPFSRPVTVNGPLPEPLTVIEKDVDHSGTDLTQFCRTCFTIGIDRGAVHILCDYPDLPPGATLEDERKRGARAVFVAVDPQDLIAWRSMRLDNGTRVLTQVRIRECGVESSGKWGDSEVQFIRVINFDPFAPQGNQGTWELWKKEQDDKDFKLVKTGTHSYPGIPLVTVYINRTGFMTADPPLEDLAMLNLAHWQSYSDQRNCLRFARVGILFGTGFDEEQLQKGITIGPSHFVGTTNEKATLEYVEHTGKAIEVGRTDLKDLENEMEVVGAQPMMEKSGDVSATGRAIDEGRTQSAIQAWIRALENGIREAYIVAGKWTNSPVGDDFKVEIFSDFIISSRPVEEMQTLDNARREKNITRPTYLNEMKRRGLLSEVVDVGSEVTALEAEEQKTFDRQKEIKTFSTKPIAAPGSGGTAE
jgi:hypothetical protein